MKKLILFTINILLFIYIICLALLIIIYTTDSISQSFPKLNYYFLMLVSIKIDWVIYLVLNQIFKNIIERTNGIFYRLFAIGFFTPLMYGSIYIFFKSFNNISNFIIELFPFFLKIHSGFLFCATIIINHLFIAIFLNLCLELINKVKTTLTTK